MHQEVHYANLVVERRVEWRSFQETPIFNLLDQREWEAILIDLICPIEELVPEFYVNLRHQDNFLHTFIRGPTTLSPL